VHAGAAEPGASSDHPLGVIGPLGERRHHHARPLRGRQRIAERGPARPVVPAHDDRAASSMLGQICGVRAANGQRGLSRQILPDDSANVVLTKNSR